MRRAIVFDFGGVLMRTIDYTPRHTWDERLGLSHGSVERAVHNSTSWVQAQSGQISVDAYWKEVAAQLSLSPEEMRKLAKDFYCGDQLDLALIRHIRQWRGDGHAVALLSNETADLFIKLRQLDIIELFDPLVISACIGVMKPSPEAYHAVLEQMNLPTQNAVFIDDRLENIEGARAVGMHGIHYVVGMDLPGALADFLRA